MKKVLLVDDDPLLLKLYQSGLSLRGFIVETASDGLAAVEALRKSPPDLLVLDLMMPRFSGVDVLKFVRTQVSLASMPVIVLSNSYMDEMGRQVAALGATKTLLKISCSAPKLAEIIRDIFAGKATSEDPLQVSAVPKPEAIVSANLVPEKAGDMAGPSPEPRAIPKPTAEEIESQAGARKEFLKDAPETCGILRNLCRAFNSAKNEGERNQRLEELYGKVHFVTATAGLAGYQHIAQVGSAFEALMFEILTKAGIMSPSMVRTIVGTVDFLVFQIEDAREIVDSSPVAGKVLVVDDDPLSNRMVVAALYHAHLQPRSTEDPMTALKWAAEKNYDLVLSDIEMPIMDGFELCKRIRALPGYRRIPVIFVTSHGDFESRAKSLFSGGDDLIAKPVYPLELAVKCVTQLLKKKARESA